MPKFNTNTIKEHFTNYLINNRKDLFDKLGFCYFHNSSKEKLDETDLETVANIAEEFNWKNDPIEVANGLYNEFINPKKWARDSKEKFELEDLDYYIDVCGEINKDLATKIKPNDKVINRTFVPKNELLGDNYRLEFITLADDSDFVYWTIIVD